MVEESEFPFQPVQVAIKKMVLYAIPHVTAVSMVWALSAGHIAAQITKTAAPSAGETHTSMAKAAAVSLVIVVAIAILVIAMMVAHAVVMFPHMLKVATVEVLAFHWYAPAIKNTTVDCATPGAMPVSTVWVQFVGPVAKAVPLLAVELSVLPAHRNAAPKPKL